MSAPGSQADLFHIGSHAALLHQPPKTATVAKESGQQLDAIVVPTIRPWSLESAIKIAVDVGCSLVVLCTTPKQAEEAKRKCGPSVGNALVTYISPAAEKNLPALRTSKHPQNDSTPSCHVDIARKRNVGLLLARMCGWRTVMFLDDDIRALTASAVSKAGALATRFQAVGFKINHYPDNSVVCHAHRLAGGTQDVFPGGSALVVDVSRSDTIFPPIYNEDWLFLFDAAQQRSVALAGTLAQLEYRPFARPQRAVSEEFGDVIAEGLYRLLHGGGDVTDATAAYWRGALERRSRLIDHIAQQLLRRVEHTPAAKYALTSLAAARDRLAELTELDCLSFVHAWRTDIDAWREQLTYVPVLGDLPGAAKYLDLPTVDGDVNW